MVMAMKLTKLLGTLLIVIAFAGNLLAKDIYSNADWASVGPNDNVTIKMSGTTKIPSNVTCKQIDFDKDNTILDLDGHTLISENIYIRNHSGLKIINGGTVHATNEFAFQSTNGKIEANVIADKNFSMSNNESMSITGNVSVGDNFYIESRNSSITGNVSVGGDLYMRNNENIQIIGNVSVNKDFIIESKNSSVTGDVSVEQSLTMRNNENIKIDGNVAVKGDLNMSGQNNNITGSAAVGGNVNTSNGSTISKGTTGYTGPISGGEEPTGEDPETGGGTTGEETACTYKIKVGSYCNVVQDFKPLNGSSSEFYAKIARSNGNNESQFFVYDGNTNISKNISVEGSIIVEHRSWGGSNADCLFLYKSDQGNPEEYYIVYNVSTGMISAQVGDPSSGGEEPTGGDDYTKYLVDDGACKKLVIPDSKNVSIPADVEIDVTNVTIGKGAKLTNNGIINIKDCSGNYIDYDFINNVFYSSDYSNSGTLENSGVIHCKNWGNNKNRDIVYNSKSFKFSNKGSIICEESFYYQKGATHVFETGCKTIINASDIVIYTSDNFALNGQYNCKNMTIDSQDGNDPFDIGSDVCTDSKITVTNTLSLKSQLSSVVVKGDAVINNMASSTSNLASMEVQGEVILGPASGRLAINSTPPSVVTLCYNPTIGKEDNFLDPESKSTYEGTIIYRVSTDTKIDQNYWTAESTPIKENDIKESSFTGKLVGNVVSFEECMQGLQHFLGIDDDPFLPKDKEIRGLYNCNPCSKDFENTKIELREIHGRTFRLINGELIYCENDN